MRGIVPINQLDNVSNVRTEDDAFILDMLERGVVNQAQVASAIAAQAGLPFVALLDFPVDRAAGACAPSAMCRRCEVLPIEIVGETLIVAVADPGDVFALDDVRAGSRLQARAVVADRSDLRAAIDRYHRAGGELTSLTSVLQEEQASTDIVPAAQVGAGEDDAPIVRSVNLLISQGIQDKASDIHMEPAEFDLKARYRIDSVLDEMQSALKSIQNGVISRLKLMSEIDISERREPQDGYYERDLRRLQ